MKLFKKKYHINEKGKERIKLIAWFIITSVLVVAATLIYVKRIDNVNDGTFIIINDSECDK